MSSGGGTSCGAVITGTVTFSDGGNVLGTSPVVVTGPDPLFGTASLAVSSLAPGSHQITALYSGDQNFAAATSTPFIQVVNTAPSVATSLSTLSFGNQLVNTTSSVQTITLTNVGSATLTINSITTSSTDFIQNNTCGSGVAVNATCSINVNFTPIAPGSESATLSISDNASGSPQTVALSGTGISLGLALSSGSSGSATVRAGQSASYNLSIGGAGFSGMATITCNLVATGANCSVPASVTVNQSTAANFVVAVTTSPRSIAILGLPRSLSPNWLVSVILLGLLIFPRPRRGAIVLGLMLVLLSCGCGGGAQHNPTGTPAGTYRVTVAASSGAASQSIPLTLVVQ